MSAIIVNGLGKAYKNYSSRWGRLAEWTIPGGRSRHELKWVLKDINFTVNPGEAVGIIGINGAGKSTLLKMIAGTTQPTTGNVNIGGRVAAMLELGMGFHPDFTGRQNAYMAGQLLGYSAEIIAELMPEIESFAGIGDYMDQPVRVYSSGMQMRLAFSVATAHRPDVLIVDEALSVGDTYFQHKSFDRIREFRRQGTTLLIVSHDKQAIQSICDRAILLNAGSVAMQGVPEEVMDYYNALLADHQNQDVRRVRLETGKVQTVSGTGDVALNDVVMLGDQGHPIEVVRVGQAVTLRISAHCHRNISELVVGYMIKDRLGQAVFGTNTHNLQFDICDVAIGDDVVLNFNFVANIGPGSYSIAVALHTGGTHVQNNYEWRDLALEFSVISGNEGDFVGVAWLPTQVEAVS